MTITRCDNCRKKLKYEQTARIRLGYGWESVELCQKCVQPIVDILKSYEILQESTHKRLQKKITRI